MHILLVRESVFSPDSQKSSPQKIKHLASPSAFYEIFFHCQLMSLPAFQKCNQLEGWLRNCFVLSVYLF